MSSTEQTGGLPTAREAPGLHGGFWRRVAAYIIDYIAVDVILGLLMLIIWIIVWLSDHAAGHALEKVYGAAFLGLWYPGSIIIFWLYFSLFESSRLQATPGKMALGLVVTDMAGRRIGFGRATGRYFAKILSALIFDVGFMMAGWTERKQALHDLIAGTCVVRKHGLEVLRTSDRFEPGTPDPGIPGWAVALIVVGAVFIVVVPIAIMAAIAIPLYLNYTYRAQQVEEAVSIVLKTRNDLVDYRAKNEAWPTPAEIKAFNDYDEAHAPVGKYTRKIRIINCAGETCVIVATMGGALADKHIAGKTFEIWTTSGGFTWHCGPGGDNPLSMQSLPPFCQDLGADGSGRP